jgi:hypothetical protein
MRLALIMAGWLLAAGTAAAEGLPACVAVQLLDHDNLPLRTETPVVGLLVGGRPILPETLPRYSGLTVGAPAPCPPALVASVRAAYDDGCLTVERRRQTARANAADEEAIDAKCKGIGQALGLVPSPER